MEMAELAWEITVDGKHAELVYGYESQPTFGILKKIAMSKMQEVDLISADFGEGIHLFYPSIAVLLDGGREMEFIGVYEATDLETPDSMNICLRYCSWDGRVDLEQLTLSVNKADYIRNSQQVKSKSLFISSRINAEIVTAIQTAILLSKKGATTTIREDNVDNPGWEYIIFSIGNDVSEYKVSYNCFVLKNSEIESWIDQWSSLLKNLVDGGKSTVLTAKYRISYKASLWDLLDSLPD